jgi:predicted TIM-barrel fold metal-dependent hydrolase
MRIDCHVHVCADTPGHGLVSPRLRKSATFRFMRWRLGLPQPDGEAIERAVEAKLIETLHGTEGIDAAVVLAFDAVYDRAGRRDDANTHLYVTNDYAIELARRHRGVLFGASVHPYRPDALAELERCVAHGAVLLKWLPVTQNMDPADDRCLPFYEALAHHKLPLLCHTGGENALPNLDVPVTDPALLEPALKRGVTVIAAHCGTQARPLQTDFLPTFVRLAHAYEHLYGDTSALNLPTRSYAYDVVLNDPVVRAKLVHGSDWPIMPVPPVKIGLGPAWDLLRHEANWMKRDVAIKQRLGFDEAYWQRAAQVLRLPAPAVPV